MDMETMSMKEAIRARVSRRSYTREPLDEETLIALYDAVEECNRLSGLNIHLIADDPAAFSGLRARNFSGVQTYFEMIGAADDPDLDEKTGYFGESLVLLATQLGLGTCWVTDSYDPLRVRVQPQEGEVLRCVIVVGHAREKITMRERSAARSIRHRRKEIREMLVSEEPVENWVIDGMRCVQRAPSSRNRQPVLFYYTDGAAAARVKGEGACDLIDLGIAKLHFGIGVGRGRWDFGNGGIFEYESGEDF